MSSALLRLLLAAAIPLCSYTLSALRGSSGDASSDARNLKLWHSERGFGFKASQGASKPSVALVYVGEPKFEERYAYNIESGRCYAKKHGYDVVVLNPRQEPYKSVCGRYDPDSVFFMKHCAVSMFLANQTAEYTAFVLDMDTLVVNSGAPLERWLSDADLTFYERVWNEEVMSGNYLARNTPFARDTLMHWAKYADRKPKGFSSADAGAIHLALMDALRLPRQECADAYSNLTADVTDLGPYNDYLACAKRSLHPPRRWVMEQADGTRGAGVTILPRAHAWVADGAYAMDWVGEELWSNVFYHGVKNMTFSREVFDLETCRIRPQRVRSEVEGGARQVARFLLGTSGDMFQRGNGERFLWNGRQLRPCASTLSCKPLDEKEAFVVHLGNGTNYSLPAPAHGSLEEPLRSLAPLTVLVSQKLK